jgi:hypothetical protein
MPFDIYDQKIAPVAILLFLAVPANFLLNLKLFLLGENLHIYKL